MCWMYSLSRSKPQFSIQEPFPSFKVCRFPFYHYRLKVIGEGIYLVVYFNTHSQVNTCVSPINTGVSITPAMKVRIQAAICLQRSSRLNSVMRLISSSCDSHQCLLLVLLSLLPSVIKSPKSIRLFFWVVLIS